MCANFNRSFSRKRQLKWYKDIFHTHTQIIQLFMQRDFYERKPKHRVDDR